VLRMPLLANTNAETKRLWRPQVARIEFVALASLFWLAIEIRNLLALALLKENGRTLFG